MNANNHRDYYGRDVGVRNLLNIITYTRQQSGQCWGWHKMHSRHNTTNTMRINAYLHYLLLVIQMGLGVWALMSNLCGDWKMPRGLLLRWIRFSVSYAGWRSGAISGLQRAMHRS
jgi:hypothetical protein